MSRLHVASIVLVALVCACGGPSSEPGPDGGTLLADADVPPAHLPRLAYQRLGRVYVVSWHDGRPGEPVQASELYDHGSIFRWSPRGAWLLVRGQGKAELIDARGDRPTAPLSLEAGPDAPLVRYATFAPSGTRVLVESADNNTGQVVLSIVDLLPDGTLSTPRTVFTGDQGALAYDWAPDSEHVALLVGDSGDGHHIWIADTGSVVPNAAQEVTSNAVTETDVARPMKWCGDSRRLMYLGRSQPGTTAKSQLWSRSLKGQDLAPPVRINRQLAAEDRGVFRWTQAADCRAVTYTTDLSLAMVDTREGAMPVPNFGVEAAREVIWSSDSRWLLLGQVSSALNAPIADLYDTDLGIPGPKVKLNAGAPAEGFVFRADGRQLIFSSDRSPSFKFLLDLSGGAADLPIALPLASGLESASIAPGSPWSSDTTKLMYEGTTPDHNSRHAVVVDLTPAGPRLLRDLGPVADAGIDALQHASSSPWAPGTNLLVYLADRGELWDPALRVIDADHPDDEPVTIDGSGSIEDWAWAP